MTPTDDAMAAIVAKLTAQGVRATTDPSALNLPGVMVYPPNRRNNLACGFSAEWSLYAIAPAPTGSGAGASFGILNQLADDVAAVLPWESMVRVGYPLGGNVLPAYLITYTEGCD